MCVTVALLKECEAGGVAVAWHVGPWWSYVRKC